MSRIKSSLLNQKLGRKLKEYKWKYSAVLKAPCNCMPGINHGNSEPKFYLGNFPHELKSTAVDTGDNCWIWKRGVWAIGPVLCHRCEHIISPDKSWFEGKGWESVQWYTTPFLFSHSTNKVLELWQHHGLQSFPYHSQYTLIFLEIKAPKYCAEPSYLAKIILLKKNAQYTQRYCVMQVALGDRFWLFIQTLNNDKKPFNSKTKSN